MAFKTPAHIQNPLPELIFFSFALVLGVQTLYMKLSGLAVGGFATVILLLLLTGSIIMCALGIIGEYIANIYDEVKRRPRYVVDETIDAAARREQSMAAR